VDAEQAERDLLKVPGSQSSPRVLRRRKQSLDPMQYADKAMQVAHRLLMNPRGQEPQPDSTVVLLFCRDP
jgi:hypothetical protein